MSQEGWSKDEAVATCGNMWQPRQVVAAGASPKEEQLGDWYAEEAKKKSALPQPGWPCRLVDALQAGTTRPAFFDWRTYSFFEASGCCFILKWHHDLEDNSLKCWAVSLGNTEKNPLYWYGATVRIAKVCAVKSCAKLGRGWDDEFQLTLAGVSLKILGLLKMIVGFPMKSTRIYRIVVYLSTSKKLQANSLLVGIRTGYNFPWTMLRSTRTRTCVW